MFSTAGAADASAKRPRARCAATPRSPRAYSKICGATSTNLSAAGITVHAVRITKISTSVSGPVVDSGNANPDNDFRYDATLAGYIYNLSTKGLTTGTYQMEFTVQDSAGSASTQAYTISFQVK